MSPTIKDLTPRQLFVAAVRKYVHKRVDMGIFSADAGELHAPSVPELKTVRQRGADTIFEEIRNPFLDPASFEELRMIPGAIFLGLSDGEKIVASNWYLPGTIVVHELQTTFRLPQGTFYSCRTFVSPEFRGRQLMAVMMSAFRRTTPECEQLVGLIYDWNEASARGVINAGWSRKGSVRAQWIFGRSRLRLEPEDSERFIGKQVA